MCKLNTVLPTNILTILVFLLTSVSISFGQYTLDENDVTFSNGEITDYLNTVAKDIVIPDTLNSQRVIAIAGGVFEGSA